MNKELLKQIIEQLSADLHKGLEDLGRMTDDDWAEVNKCMGYCLGVSHAINFLTNIYHAL